MRLTEKDVIGNWKLSGVEWKEIKPGAKITNNVWQKLYGALWKLGDYEDTGLNPKEVREIQEAAQAPVAIVQPPDTLLTDNATMPRSRKWTRLVRTYCMWMLIAFLWMALETLIYHEIQPRTVDNIMWALYLPFIYMALREH